MKSKSDGIKTTNKIFLLALSIFLIDISILYLNSYGKILLNQVMLVPLGISVIFGFFSAVRILKLEKFINDKNSLLSVLYLTFFYTAWYNVILLPVSGFGALEWILFAVIIFSDFLLSLSGKSNQNNLAISYINSSSSNLMYFGVLMFILKIVIYNLLPDNLYIAQFVGNSTARFFVLLFCVVGLILLLSFLIKFVKSKVSFSKKQKSVAFGFFKKIGQVFSEFFKLILSVFSGPIFIIILVCLIFLFGIVIFAQANAICDDIMRFVEPILIKLSSTGKSAITPSVFYFVAQIIVVISVLIFTKIYHDNLEKLAKEKIKNELHQNIDKMQISADEKQKIFEQKQLELENQKDFIVLLCEPQKMITFANESEGK